MSTFLATRRVPTASSSSRSSLSISSGDDPKKFSRPQERDEGRRRRLSLMPPAGTLPPEADGRLSSIHDSDNTSVIKQKINSKPIRGDATEEYQTTKKVKNKLVFFAVLLSPVLDGFD